jgi:hypothetical protein
VAYFAYCIQTGNPVNSALIAPPFLRSAVGRKPGFLLLCHPRLPEALILSPQFAASFDMQES